MNREKDILKELKAKGTGFKIPENYLSDFSIDLPEENDIKLPEDNGFKVPENYFEELNEKLLHKIDSKIPKETGFRIPDGYLNTFEIKTEAQKESGVIRLFKENRNRIIGISVAAMILVLFSVYPLFNYDKSLDFSSLSDNDIESWLEANSDQINSLELAEMIDDTDDLYAVETISEQDISDYLIQTDIESWIPDN